MSEPDVDDASVVRRPPFGSNPLVGERGSDTQRRILAAALEVFAEVGFHDARVELITERAGCSRPAFYQYFSSKDDVFWTLAGRLGQDMVELGDRLGAVSPDRTGLAALTTWLDGFADLYDEHAPVFDAFQAAMRGHEPIVRGSGSISDRLGEALVRNIGVSRSGPPPDRLANGLVAVLVRCNFYRLNALGGIGRVDFVEGVARIVHRVLAGPIPRVNVVAPDGDRRRRRSAQPPAPSTEARPLRPRGEKTRQRLLEAGAAVLPSRGYNDTRVDDIVAKAGVSHGSFYRYFENKDDFFRVLAEQASTQLIALLDAFPPADDAESLRAWLGDWFAAYRSNGGVISTWQEMQASDSPLVAFSQAVGASVIDRLTRILSDQGVGDSTVDALVFLAVIERLPYTVLTLGFAEEPEAIEATLVLLRRGVLGVPD